MGESEAIRLSYTVTSLGDGDVVVALDGELDISTVEPLGATVAEALPRVEARLIVDVSRLQFVDSSGIALWVGWSRAVPRIEILAASPLVLRVIQTMGLTEILNPS
jgi:anti-sigma B factor antagonist